MPLSWAAQTHKQSPEDSVKYRVKYAHYFQGNRILLIPELIRGGAKIPVFIITDIKTRRLAGIKKETFEKLLMAAGIPAKYIVDVALLIGMSCCHQRNWLSSWLGAI